MKSTYPIQSVKKQSSNLFFLILSILFLLAGLVVIYFSFQEIYFNLFLFLMGFLFSGLGTLFLYFIVSETITFIFQDRIEVHNSPFGKTKKYFNYEIEGFAEDEIQDEDFVQKTILINTKDQLLEFNSLEYENYEELKNALAENYTFLDNTLFKKEAAKIHFIFKSIIASLGFVFVLLGIYLFFSKPSIISQENIVELNLKLSEKPSIMVSNSGSKSKPTALRLNFEEHPDFNFTLKKVLFENSNAFAVKENFRKGDRLRIGIEKRIFNIKILKTEEPGFMNKHFFWNDIPVYSIKNGTEVYADLDPVYFSENNRDLGISFFAGGLVLFLVMVFHKSVMGLFVRTYTDSTKR